MTPWLVKNSNLSAGDQQHSLPTAGVPGVVVKRRNMRILNILVGAVIGFALGWLVMDVIDEVRSIRKWGLATISLPGIGTETGPCVDEDCGDPLCEVTREMAATKCMACGESIGYNTPFLLHGENDDEMIHAACQ